MTGIHKKANASTKVFGWRKVIFEFISSSPD
jgi:hypothetical protein